MDNSNKKAQIALKKAKTSLEKIIKMIDDDVYCIDILQQILAVKGLLNSSAGKILDNHLKHCFSHGFRTKDKDLEEKLINELITVINIRERTK